MTQLLHLDAWCNFSLINGPRRTHGTSLGVSEKKNALGAKNTIANQNLFDFESEVQ
jgi:hypothetical protein